MDEYCGLLETELEQDACELERISARLGWLARRRMEQELDAFNLTPPQYVALRSMMDREQGCTMTELAEAAYQVSATMTGIIDRLVERGLVQRERAPRDRRSLSVRLTPAGWQLLSEISAVRQARVRQVLEELTPEERRGLVAMSRRYLEVVEKALQPASI
jgi:DNA-binding MarR family transcriptional regulator